jgi:ERF superfamily
VLEKLIALQERMENNQARRAFDAAIAEAKTELPPIPKNKDGHGGRRYASMDAIARAVDPVITHYGLSYRFRSTEAAGRITVFCRISHRDGYFEENSLSAPIDTGPGRNPIQAIGSTLTYLQRYSIIQALGLAVTDEDSDDDGESYGEVPQRLVQQPAKNGNGNRREYADFVRGLFSMTREDELLSYLASYVDVMQDWPAASYQDAVEKFSHRLAGINPEFRKYRDEAASFRSAKKLVDWGGTLKIEGKSWIGVFRKFFGVKLAKLRERDEELARKYEDQKYANAVVHDTEGDPRDVTVEDFDPVDHEAQSISERAIAARDRK